MLLSPRHAFGSYLPSPQKISQIAGDYWARFYGAQDQLYSLSGAIQQEYRQEIRNVHEIAGSHNINSASLFHRETFWPVLIDPSTVTPAPIVYGDEYVFGDGPGSVFFGETIEDAWWFPIDQAITGFCGACESIVAPDVFLTAGMQAHIRRTAESNHIEMLVDPRTIFRTITDQYGRNRLLVWLYMPTFERYTVARRFGTIVETFLPSTEAYRAAMSATLDSYVLGGSELQLRRLLAAAVDEVVAEEGEVVEYILTGRPTPIVITDRRTIPGRAGKVPNVQVGQRLELGDFFFDTVKFTDFHDGVPEWMQSLTLPKRITGTRYDVTIPSGDISMSASRTSSGTRLEFAIGSTDFWDWLNQPSGHFAAFVASLAGVQVADPFNVAPTDLPAQLDLLDALAQSPLRYSISVSQIDSEHLVPEAVPLLRLVREVVPPWVSHIIQFNGDPPAGWTNSNDCDPGLQLLSRPERTS